MNNIFKKVRLGAKLIIRWVFMLAAVDPKVLKQFYDFKSESILSFAPFMLVFTLLFLVLSFRILHFHLSIILGCHLFALELSIYFIAGSKVKALSKQYSINVLKMVMVLY